MPHEIVSFDEPKLREYLGGLVRKTIEDSLNALLDEEADQIANASRYERTDERQAYRSGHYRRNLTTTSGNVTLNVPKLRGATFASRVIERYRRRETSVEEAMMEMYLAGVSTRRIQDVSEILWGASVSPATVSKLNRKAFGAVDEWRHRRLEGDYPYVYLDGTYIKRNWGGAYEGVAVLVAIGVNARGYREVIGCEEGYVCLVKPDFRPATPRLSNTASTRRTSSPTRRPRSRSASSPCRASTRRRWRRSSPGPDSTPTSGSSP
jgi:putative transposase